VEERAGHLFSARSEWLSATSAAVIIPLATIAVMTTPKQKMGKMYSNIFVPPRSTDDARQEGNPDADPKSKDAGYPETDENAVVFVDEEPEGDAAGEAGAGGEKKRMIDFVEHDDWFFLMSCLIFV
jgi:hypothetical protein